MIVFVKRLEGTRSSARLTDQRCQYLKRFNLGKARSNTSRARIGLPSARMKQRRTATRTRPKRDRDAIAPRRSLPGREPASAALIRLKFGLLITMCVCVRMGRVMSNDNAGWDLDVLGRQVGPHKSEILDLESRVNWSEQFVGQHERDIKQTRFETARIANELEHRISEQGRHIERQGRLIRFLADVLFAVIAALFGGFAAAYVHGDIYWTAGFGVAVFLLTLLAGYFLFRGLAASLLGDPLAKQQKWRNRIQGI